MSDEQNGWNEWSKHVLKELDRLTNSNEAMRTELQTFKVDITRELAKKTEVDELREELAKQQVERIEAVSSIRTEMTKEITELQRIHSEMIAEINTHHSVALAEIKTDLRNKAGVWGGLAGAVPVVVGLMMMGLRSFIR